LILEQLEPYPGYDKYYILSGPGKHFKRNVRPRWYTYGGVRKSVGVEIMNPPWGWTEFVMNFEPVVEEDVWGEVRL
jgi:hypothetical protein